MSIASDTTSRPPTGGARLFCSYAHEDAARFVELKTHLAALKRSHCIDLWSDHEVRLGDDWKRRTMEALEASDLALLLISSDFIASDTCFEIVMLRALELAETGQAIVVPVIVRPCVWQSQPFASRQMLPQSGIPITQQGNPPYDAGWADVTASVQVLLDGHIRARASVATTSCGVSDELVLRFLRTWPAWGFNPARIRNWGGRQSGFEGLAHMSLEHIGARLQELLASGMVRAFQSKSGGRLFKAAPPGQRGR